MRAAMAHVKAGDVRLYYEEVGQGLPLVFVHEFAGDALSWAPQLNFFARRYRAIAFNARGYPPSDVPDAVSAYSQAQAAADITGVLDGLGIAKAHVCGLSMGGYAALHFGLTYPDRALSITVAGAGYGSGADREAFRKDTEMIARRFDEEGMAKVAEFYSRGPTRVQFIEKDPRGWQEFHDRLAAGSARGHALTLRGVQMSRPSIFDLGDAMARCEVPTLIMTGDEDDPCLESGIFMKRTLPRSGLVVLPKAGHAINIEEPAAFNTALLDFLGAVDAGRWPRRRADSVTGSAVLPPDVKR
jgi:pimeloyl-ACP methyl ester carboxylesterase